MTFSLYHAVNPAFWLEAERAEEQACSISEKTHRHVANVTTPDIGNVVALTTNYFIWDWTKNKNFDWDWPTNEGVTLTPFQYGTDRLRSTLVGDVIEDEEGRFFIVTRVGLRETRHEDASA